MEKVPSGSETTDAHFTERINELAATVGMVSGFASVNDPKIGSSYEDCARDIIALLDSRSHDTRVSALATLLRRAGRQTLRCRAHALRTELRKSVDE